MFAWCSSGDDHQGTEKEMSQDFWLGFAWGAFFSFLAIVFVIFAGMLVAAFIDHG